VLLEIEVPESEAGQTRPIADVEVSYANMQTKTTDQLSSGISVYFDPSTRVVQDRVNVKVMAECVLQIANERNEQAVALRDRGQTQQAKALLELNATYLSQNALDLKSDKLQKRAMDNVEQSQGLDPEEWKRTRKISRSLQYEDARQQRALPPSTND
jgi:Ca-activated chloride channel family protein